MVSVSTVINQYINNQYSQVLKNNQSIILFTTSRKTISATLYTTYTLLVVCIVYIFASTLLIIATKKVTAMYFAFCVFVFPSMMGYILYILLAHQSHYEGGNTTYCITWISCDLQEKPGFLFLWIILTVIAIIFFAAFGVVELALVIYIKHGREFVLMIIYYLLSASSKQT